MSRRTDQAPPGPARIAPRTSTAVLLVDDQDSAIAALEAVFADAPYDVVSARSGQEALRLVLERDFAAVVLDVRMPDIDGFETSRLIRARPRTRHLPILFQTGFDLDREATVRAYQLGAVDLVTKPVPPEILRAKVDVFVELFERSKDAREQRARYESLAALSPVGVFQADAAGDCVWVNPRWSEITGLTLREAVDSGWERSLHPDDLARVVAEWDVAVREGHPFRSEFRCVRPDGKSTWVLGQSRAERDAAGRVTGHVGTLTDIGDQKRAEETLLRGQEALEHKVEERSRELRFANEELGMITDHLPVLISSVGADERYLRVSRGYERWFGRPAESIEGRHLRDILGEAAYQAILPHVRAALAGNEVTYDTAVPYAGGGTRHIRATYIPRRDREGRVDGFLALVIDISDAKRAEMAGARLAAIVESSEDAIVGKTLDGTVTSWNRSAERLFGYTSEEIVGQSITLLIPEELRSEEEMILARLRRGERVLHYETRRRAKDGRILDVSLSVSPIQDRQGRIVGASKVARDITERARAEREIRRLNAELEGRVRERTGALETTAKELDAFAYSVSHDLRAPLRTMNRYSDIVLEEFAGRILDEEGQDFLRRIGNASRQMDELIQNLLAYSRLGRDAVDLADIPLDAALDDALDVLAGDLQERRATVRRDSPLPAARADKVLLGQVFTNLLSNALRFTEPGVPPVVRVRAESRGDRVRVWVEDNGIGIAPEHHERIFRIFERLNPRQFGGTGVGLAIVKRAMERMRGDLGLESAPGAGSRFWIEFLTTESNP
ncbi:MAG TPA: PAS domain S-box protein [Planctomycetota bacterium]